MLIGAGWYATLPNDSGWERINSLYASVEVYSKERVFDLAELAGLVVTVFRNRVARSAADIVGAGIVANGMRIVGRQMGLFER